MANPGLIKNFTAEAAVLPRRIVKHGATDFSALHGAAATDALFGVTAELAADAGARVDVILTGTADVEYGGTVNRGDPITSDAVGRAVASTPAAGVNNRIVGFAGMSGVVGEIGLVQIAPGRIQG